MVNLSICRTVVVIDIIESQFKLGKNPLRKIVSKESSNFLIYLALLFIERLSLAFLDEANVELNLFVLFKTFFSKFAKISSSSSYIFFIYLFVLA